MKFFIKEVVIKYVCRVELFSMNVGFGVVGFYGLFVGEVEGIYGFE